MYEIWKNMWPSDSEERSEVRVVMYTFLQDLEKFLALPTKALGLGKIPSFTPSICSEASMNEALSEARCEFPYVKPLGLGKILSSVTWKNCERSLEARLERHERCLYFLTWVINRREIEKFLYGLSSNWRNSFINFEVPEHCSRYFRVFWFFMFLFLIKLKNSMVRHRSI